MTFGIPRTGPNLCTDPPLGERLLSQTDLGQPSDLDPELADHVLTCTVCWGVVERARRARAVWTADTPSDAEITAAFARVNAGLRGRATAGARSLLGFAALGAALASVILLLLPHGAKDDALGHARDATPSSSVAGVAFVSPPAPAAPPPPADEGVYLLSPSGRVPLTDGARIRLGRGEHGRVVIGAGWAPIEVEGPGLVEAWSAPSETCGWRFELSTAPATETTENREKQPSTPNAPARTRILMPVRVVEPPRALGVDVSNGGHVASGALGGSATVGGSAAWSDPTRGVAGASRTAADTTAPGTERMATRERAAVPEHTAPAVIASATVPPGAWARAASALDRGDFAGADRALAELCRDADGRTRDAARLTRAKLWVGHGRAAAARPVLEDLAANGATPLVRRDAQELLDEGRAP